MVSAQQKFPATHEIKNIVQPVRLNTDTTTFVLTDYFVSPGLIDSISLPPSFKWNWDKTEQLVTVETGKNIAPLEELKTVERRLRLFSYFKKAGEVVL